MIDDPIVTEVRKVRDRHAAKFNYDLDAIYRDLKQKEKLSGRSYVRFPPRLYEPPSSPDQMPVPAPVHGTRPSEVVHGT
jgi:hypothetical protein